jgi:hypothetical protein
VFCGRRHSDEFGKTVFPDDFEGATAPDALFYVAVVCPSVHYTMGACARPVSPVLPSASTPGIALVARLLPSACVRAFGLGLRVRVRDCSLGRGSGPRTARPVCAGGVRISASCEVQREEPDEPMLPDGTDAEAADPMEPPPPVQRAIPGLFAAGTLGGW